MADSILALGANFQEIYEIISAKFKNLAVFALCVLAMFACKDFVSLDNWLKFAIFAAIYAGAAYVLGYFLFFNAFERGIVWRKILKKFKRS